jgi:hypothetical protein
MMRFGNPRCRSQTDTEDLIEPILDQQHRENR